MPPLPRPEASQLRPTHDFAVSYAQYLPYPDGNPLLLPTVTATGDRSAESCDRLCPKMQSRILGKPVCLSRLGEDKGETLLPLSPPGVLVLGSQVQGPVSLGSTF